MTPCPQSLLKFPYYPRGRLAGRERYTMATYGTIQDNLADYLSRTDLTTLIQTAIQRAIKYYERQVFWFNEQDDSIVTVSGTKNYTLSATVGYTQINQVILNYHGQKYELDEMNSEDLQSQDIGTITGQPLWWAQINGGVMFYPTPDGSYTVSYNFVQKTATLSATTDSNFFTTNAEDLIESRALWWLCVNKTRNPVLAQNAKQTELEALRNLKSETTNKLTSGRLKPTKF